MKSVLNNTEQMAFFVRRPIDLHKTLEMLPESRCERNCVCARARVCVCARARLRWRALVSLAMCMTGTEQVDKGGCKANSGAVLLSLLMTVPQTFGVSDCLPVVIPGSSVSFCDAD